jgi:choline dehydrogenase-like flavoprotein
MSMGLPASAHRDSHSSLYVRGQSICRLVTLVAAFVRDWNFTAEPNPHLNSRGIPYDMGKVLGGGSSINVMIWARGHKNDWELHESIACCAPNT